MSEKTKFDPSYWLELVASCCHELFVC